MSNGIDVLQAQIAQLKRNQRRLALGYAGMGRPGRGRVDDRRDVAAQREL